jgi:hypothetical protein
MDHLVTQAISDDPDSVMVGLREGKVTFTPLAEFEKLVEADAERPRGAAWWMALRPLTNLMTDVSPQTDRARPCGERPVERSGSAGAVFASSADLL